MRRLRWFGCVALQAAIAGCGGDPGGVEAAPGDIEAPGEAMFAPDEETELWLVELDHATTSRGGDRAALLEERARFRQQTRSIGLRFKERFSFDRLWNGLSVRVPAGSSAALAALPGVKGIYPVLAAPRDESPASGGGEPDLYSAAGMSGADVVHSELGFTGERVLVGIIDSGVDYHHPDLGGCFGPGCRVAYGHDFVGDDFNGGDGSTQPVPDGDPDDCGGHGTHVAGIVGASGAVHGVAFGATLGAYRVFGCSGSTNTDIMMAAMERAEADGMRVVNMSIGSQFAWPSYPSAKAANQLVENGVVVVTSIGNNGEKGLWAAGAPGVGEHVIGTAAIDNVAITLSSFTISPTDTPIGYTQTTGAPVAPLSGDAPLVRTGTTTTVDDGCDPLPDGSMTGAVVLIRRGTCGFNQKAANAQAAGAVGVVLYNNASGLLNPTVATGTPIVIPVVATTAALGALLNDHLDAADVTMTWTDELTGIPSQTGNLVSSFSSYGLTASLSFKPDIAAPGGGIYSTYPLELGGYATLGGTSMASPHVAGTVALLLSARSDVAPMDVRDLLQNHAVPTVWSGDVAAGVPDAAFRQGAGRVRIDRAILATTLISPGKLAPGESEAGPSQATLTIKNMGPSDVAYDVSHVPAVSAPAGNHWLVTNSLTGAAEVQLGAPMVAVPAGGAATLDVTITASDALAEGSLYGGYLVFTPVGGSEEDALRVPYAGFVGDYQSVPVMTPTAQGFPWLASRSGSTYTKLPNGGTFTLQSGNVPYAVVHLDHNAQRLKMEIFDAATSKPYGSVLDQAYVIQNILATDSNKYAWSGYVTQNKKTSLIPNGTYVMRVSALRAMGSEGNPAHWEVWTSPPVTINRP